MKEYLEFSAKTVDEAITKALLELGISSDRLEYEVKEKGSTGILGIFTKPAVIRVVKPSQDEDDFLLNDSEKEEKKEETPVRPAVSKTSEPAPKKAQAKKETPVKKEVKKEAPVKKEQPEKEPVEKPVSPEKEENPSETPASNIDPASLMAKVEDFLSGMFKAMQMEVTIDTDFDREEKTVLVNLSGDDMGVLIGKRGQTLDSIQYLCSLVVNKGEDEYIRVKVDTENYRERRKETLETLARNISYKVKRTKRPVSLEPMNPYERRVIHAALQNDKYVVTRSEGVEPYRHIVISPKNTRYGSKK